MRNVKMWKLVVAVAFILAMKLTVGTQKVFWLDSFALFC